MGRISDARERLIQAAIRLLRERGYGAASVDLLCQEAKANKGSFYHFFPAKSDLALAALDRCWDDFQRQIIEPAFRREVPPLARLERFFALLYEQQLQNHQRTGQVYGCFFGSLGNELSGQDEAIRSRAELFLGRVSEAFHQALKEARERGEIRLADAAVASRAICALMEGMLLQAKVANHPEVLRDLAPQAFHLLGVGAGMVQTPSPQTEPSAPSAKVMETLDFLD